MDLTAEQQIVLDKVIEWANNSTERELTLGGYAGTGKTTLIKSIVGALSSRHRIGVCALSGKAAFVLKSKGVMASTIHSLIYNPIVDEAGAVTFDKKDKIDSRLTIVDEASMVDSRIYRDIMHFPTRVLWVGDHGQLEPIGENPGLMVNPTLRLDTIMRQALESPILRLAHKLREDLPLEYGVQDGEGSIVLESMKYGQMLDDIRPDQIIVGTNETRHKINAEARSRRGHSKLLEVGDRIICLRNNYSYQLFNGMQATVTKVSGIKGNLVEASIIDESGRELPDLIMNASQFGANSLPVTNRDDLKTYFDYAYAITCHKAQGSEWDKVVVLEQISGSWARKRWSYTAATRAKKELWYVRKL